MLSSSKRSFHLWLNVLALLFAMFLAAHNIEADFLWWDEHWSTQIAGTGMYGPLAPAEIWQRAIEDPWHPPLFYLALSAWNAVLGGTQFALRLFPLFTGLLTLSWIYRLGAWLSGRQLGLAAVLIMSGAAFLLGYFAELRPYMLHALFGVSTAALYWRLINGKPSRRLYLGFTLSVAGLLYTHYFALLFGVALGCYHLLFVRKNAAWWRLMACAVGGVLTFLPWLSVVLTAVTSVSGDPRFSVLSVDQLLLLLADGMSNGVGLFLPLLMVGGIVALRFAAGRFVVWMGVAILCLAIMLNAFVPMLTHLRYIITVWGFAIVIAAYGALWLARQQRYGRAALALLLIAWWGTGSVAMLTPDFQNRMFRQEFLPIFRSTLPLYAALQSVQADLQGHDVVLYDSPVEPWAVAGGFSYYTQGWNVPRSMLSWLPGDDVLSLAQTVRDYTSTAQRVWLISETQAGDFRREAFQQAANGVLTYCETRYAAPELRVEVYSKYAQCCTPPVGEIARYDEGFVLHSLDVVGTSADTVTLLARWSVEDTVPDAKYSVGFYVLDAQNNVIAQTDASLQTYLSSCQPFDLPKAQLPPGDHVVYMTVYAWQDLSRLTGTAGDVTSELLPVAFIHTD